MPKTSKKTKKSKTVKILEGIDFLTQRFYVKKYEILSKRISKINNLSFTMAKGFSSFTRYDEKLKKFFMNIDPWVFQDNSRFTIGDYNLIIRALIYHEAAHILYTDFQVTKNNLINLKKANKNIAEIADDLMSSTPTKTENDLTEAIYQYYYQKFLRDMLNSMEDASIEASISSKYPESYANLIFLRNYVNEKEFESIQTCYPTSLIDDIIAGTEKITEDFIQFIITEIRSMATVGYRKYLTYYLMPRFYDDDEIEEFERIAHWCRFVAPTTLERNIAAKTLLDMLKDKILYPFAEYITQEYKTSLDDLKKKIDNDEKLLEEKSENEESIASGSSGTGSGGTRSKMGTGKGDGDLPLPKSLAKEAQDKIRKEMEKAKLAHEKSLSSSEKESEEKKEEDEDTPSSTTSDEYVDKSEKETGKESQVPDYNKSKEELSKEAESKLKKALKNSSKPFKKVQEAIDRSAIESGKVLAENGKIHEGVSVQEGTVESFGDDVSDAGASVRAKIPHLMEYANPLSKNMKKLLMHKARNRSLKGQYVGKLDMNSLYRAKTDGRVFRKDTEGEQTNVRICILVDESGSMHWDSKIERAIQGCYVVAKAAQKIKVPFAIYGHTESSGFELRQYVDYKNCFKKRSVDNIFKMDSRHNNRDGLAIYKCLCSLVQNKGQVDEKQILIVISDGQPAAHGYGGHMAEKEMQAIMNKFEKLYGISTIGVAIGNDCEEVAAIYKNCVMVKNVSELPNKMIEILRSIVL